MEIKTGKDFRTAIKQGPYAWPGGYPTFFITSDGEALSFNDAKKNAKQIIRAIRDKDRGGWNVVAFEINWEDNELYSSDSNEKIESAYAENPRKRKSYGGEARKVFDNYNAARQSESETYLRTPKGEAERKARNAAMLARMRAKRNPTTRAVTLDDMNMAIRGLRMNSLDGDELRELIALHKDSEMFAGQVTAAAARHVLKSKQRVGLIRNPRKRTPAQQAATAKMLAANRMQNARRFPAAKSLTSTIAKIRRMHAAGSKPPSAKIAKIRKMHNNPKSNRITVSHCAPGATHYGAIAFFPNDAKGQKRAIDYAKNLKKKNKSHSFRVTK